MSRRLFQLALAAVASLLGLLFVATAEACFNPEASVSPRQAEPGDTVTVTVSDLDAEDHFFIEVNGDRVTDDLKANGNSAKVSIVVPEGDEAEVDAYIYDSRNKANSDDYLGWQPVRTPIRPYNTITRPDPPPSAPSTTTGAPQDAPANSAHTSAPVNPAPPAYGGGAQGTPTPGNGGPNPPVATGGAEVADVAGHAPSSGSMGDTAAGTARTAALAAAGAEHAAPSASGRGAEGEASGSAPGTKTPAAQRSEPAPQVAPPASPSVAPLVDPGDGPPVAVLVGAGLLFFLAVTGVGRAMARRRGGAEPAARPAGPPAPVPSPLAVPAIEPDQVEIELQELISEERARQLAQTAEPEQVGF
jgi:hypothetical protein